MSATDSGENQANFEPLTALRDHRKELVVKRRKIQFSYYTFWGMGFFALGIGVIFLVAVLKRPTSGGLPLEATGIFVYPLILWGLAPTLRMRLRDVETDLQDIDFQIDLQQFEVGKEESRAEKILRINQLQLRRYYDMNLSQNFWVFSLGVFCIVLGVVVIVTSLYLVLKVAIGTDSKIIVASLGAVGSILANFVAGIYLRMNTSASQNLAEFHSRLIDTQQLLIANLLASRIKNDEQRWRTLAELATGMASTKQCSATSEGQ